MLSIYTLRRNVAGVGCQASPPQSVQISVQLVQDHRELEEGENGSASPVLGSNTSAESNRLSIMSTSAARNSVAAG